VFQVAEARAAVVFLHRDAMEAEFAHLRPEVAREAILAVDLRRQRRDFARGKGRDALAQHVRGFTKIEIQAWQAVGDHLPLLGRMAPSSSTGFEYVTARFQSHEGLLHLGADLLLACLAHEDLDITSEL